jgi:hypothetical protein
MRPKPSAQNVAKLHSIDAIDRIVKAFVARGMHGDLVESIRRQNQEGDVFQTMRTIMQIFVKEQSIHKDESLLSALCGALEYLKRYAETLFEYWDKRNKNRWRLIEDPIKPLKARFSCWSLLKEIKQYSHDVETWKSELNPKYEIVENHHQQFHNVPRKLRRMPHEEHRKMYANKQRKIGKCIAFKEYLFLDDVTTEIGSLLHALNERNVSENDLKEVMGWLFFTNDEQILVALKFLNMLFEKHGFYTDKGLVQLLVTPWRTFLLYWRAAYDNVRQIHDCISEYTFDDLKRCSGGWKVAEHWNDCHSGGGKEKEYSEYIPERFALLLIPGYGRYL